MESFTIQCTSCESRIRVRNPNMIGQIANCPKCGSMILIAAPQQITVESGNPTDSVAVTREALPVPDEDLLSAPSVFETGFRIDGLPASTPQSVDLAHSLPDDEYRLMPDPPAKVESEKEASSDALPLGAWLPESNNADPLPPPSVNNIDSSIQAVRAKRQESAAKSRQVMLVATIALCSVLIAVGILVVFLRWINQPAVVAQNGQAKNNLAAGQPTVNHAGGDLADPASNSADATKGSQQTVPGEDSLPGDVKPGDIKSIDSLPMPAEPSIPPVTPPVSPPAVTAADVPASSPTPTTQGNASAPRSPIGGSIAPSLNDVLGGTQPDSKPAGDAPLELPPGLQGFSKLFNQSFDPALPDASVPLEKEMDLPEEPKDKPNKAANSPAAPAADLLPATVDKMLSTQLSGVAIDKRPLSEALTTLSLVGDVPIVPDVDALLVAGASKSTLVEVKARSAITFDAVLQSVASSTKIRLVPWENRVIYARVSDEELESRLPAELPISDLVMDDGQRDQLVQGLKEVLPELGDALQVGAGGLQLSLTNENRLTWFQLARLLESWRVARGIVNEKTSQVVPKTSLLPAWPVEAMQQVAVTPLKQIVPSEPMARTWQRLTAEARVACWVDWYGLQMAEVNPRQKGTVITKGRTLADVLQHYANKFQIVFAIDDSRAVWVTSQEMHRLQPRLYLLPLAEKSLEDWTAELEPLAPVNPATGASMLKLVPTPDGQYLMVRCCRPILVAPDGN